MRQHVARKLDIEAVGIAGLGEQLLRLRRIVVVGRRDLAVAAELRRDTWRERNAAAAGDELLGDRLAVDRVPDRLTHLELGHGVVGAGAAAGIEREIADPHRFLAHRLQMRHPVHGLDLVRVQVPDPVGAAGEQFRHLGRGVRHEAHAHLLDRRLPLGAAGPVILEPLEVDGDAGLDLGHLVRTRADRRLGIAFRADLLAIGLGIDRDDEREIFQRRGVRPLQLDAHREIAGLLRLFEPVVVRRRRQPARRIGDQVDGVDDVIGRKRAAVVELDAGPQRELDRGRIRQLPLGGEQRPELERIRIAVDQRVPALVVHHHAGAQIVVVGIDIGQRVAHHDPQRVGGFLRRRGHRTGAEQDCRQNCRAELVLHTHFTLRHSCFAA